MYEPIYDILFFGEYSPENSKIAVFFVESQNQFKIPLAGRDVRTSDLGRKLIFT